MYKWGQHTWDHDKFHVFWQRDLLGTPVNPLLSSQECQGVLFPQSVNIHDFCSGPISVDPICLQPSLISCLLPDHSNAQVNEATLVRPASSKTNVRSPRMPPSGRSAYFIWGFDYNFTKQHPWISNNSIEFHPSGNILLFRKVQVSFSSESIFGKIIVKSP